jgi:hypothetical protein
MSSSRIAAGDSHLSTIDAKSLMRSPTPDHYRVG